MASIIGAKNGLIPKSHPRSHDDEDIKVSPEWIEDQNNHYRLVVLPGFKKEDMKMETNCIDKVTISGERQEGEYKFLRFELKFKVPENSDIRNISGMLEDGILTVTLPKRVVPPLKEEYQIPYEEKAPSVEMEEPPSLKLEDGPREDKSETREFCEERKEMLKKLEDNDDGNLFKSALEALKNNTGIFLTVVIAFSLGVLVSCNFNVVTRKIITRRS